MKQRSSLFPDPAMIAVIRPTKSTLETVQAGNAASAAILERKLMGFERISQSDAVVTPTDPPTA